MGVTLPRWKRGGRPAPADTTASGPRLQAESEAMGTVLLAGLGVGSGLMAWSLWSRLGWTHPPAAALAAAVTLAVAARGLGEWGHLAGRTDAALGDGEFGGAAAGVALLLPLALVAGFSQWQRLGAAVPGIFAALAVWAAWFQAGRLWRDFGGRGQGRADRERLRREDLPAQADQPTDGEGEALRGDVAAWWLVSGLLAVSVPLRSAGRPAPLLAAVAVALETTSGAMLLAHGVRRHLLQQAERQGARVLPGFALQASAALGAVLVTVGLALALPAWPTLPTLRWGHSLARALAPRGASPPPPTLLPPPGHPAPPPASSPAPPAALWGPVLLLSCLGLALLLVVAIRRLVAAWGRGRARPWFAGGFWEFLVRLWRLLGEAFAALWAGMGSWTSLWSKGRRPQGAWRSWPGADPGAAGRRGQTPWIAAGDARARVRAAYRRLLMELAAHGHHRHRAASPRAFARQLAPLLPGTGDAHRQLTELYERARYSPHPLSPRDAGAADQAADAVVRRLRAP